MGKHAKSQGPYICWPIVGSGPCCLPWPLAVGPGATAEDPNSLAATVDTPQCFLKTPQLWTLWISVAWAEEISHFPNLVLSHTLILVTLYF